MVSEHDLVVIGCGFGESACARRAMENGSKEGVMGSGERRA